MAFQLRYKGSFLGKDGRLGGRPAFSHTVEIYQQSSAPFAKVEELTFPAASPLVIDYDSMSKEESVCGSRATLKIISPEDRTYVDLYTTQPGAVRMDVLRDGKLFWSGTLDTEFYEEPYESVNNYNVSLTFEDFGILDRLQFDLSGTPDLLTIVDHALSSACLNYSRLPREYQPWTRLFLDTSAISLKLSGLPFTLDQLCVSASNFTDENGKKSTYKEVLKAILQPLGLRIVQRTGCVYIYDLNGIHSLDAEPIYWTDDSRTLGTDKVANEVVIEFSPYADTTLYSGSLDAADVARNGAGHRVMLTDAGDKDERIDGFTVYLADSAKNTKFEIGQSMKFFRIVADYSGSNEAGVAALIRDTDNKLFGAQPTDDYSESKRAFSADPPVVLIAEPCALALSQDAAAYKLKISLDMLFDVRYNPFEQSSLHNEEGNHSKMVNWMNFAYVPVKIELLDSFGKVIKHYDNSAVMLSSKFAAAAAWVDGAASWGDAWLGYYDSSNRKSASGLGGWQTNKQCIGYFRDDLPEIFSRRGNGEFIPLPDAAGSIRLTVGYSIHWFDYGRRGNIEGNKPILDYCRWMLFRNPKIEVVNANGTSISYDDIQYSGILDESAAEPISISTVCGTSAQSMSTARGLYRFSANGLPLSSQLQRAGNFGIPEQLLINSLFSQFATRHNKISGEANIVTGLRVFSEDAQPEGVVFMTLSESMDLIEGTDVVELVELTPDIYTPLDNG